MSFFAGAKALERSEGLSFLRLACSYVHLVSREWKNGSNGSYNCTPFLHSLLTKGKCLQESVENKNLSLVSRLAISEHSVPDKHGVYRAFCALYGSMGFDSLYPTAKPNPVKLFDRTEA